ncbi:hypothetical protein D9M68_123650 [compost metagenome]
MVERPILFSGAMVRAILDGRKTQTRRIVKLPHSNPLGVWEPTTFGGPNGGRTADGGTIPLQGGIWHTRTGDCLASPYGLPGDRLWVRETWQHSNHPFGPYEPDCLAFYRADYLDDPLGPDLERSADGIRRQWRPSIHMPRAACRLALEITGVRVERLNDCSEQDAAAEGVTPISPGAAPCIDDRARHYGSEPTAVSAFASLWDSINGAGAWETNAWVWAIEFKRIAP